jgi:hypothetical protein
MEIAVSRPNRIIPGTLWIGGSNDKNGVYPTTQLLPGVASVSIKIEGNGENNYGNRSSTPRPHYPASRWIGRSNDKNGVYPNKQLLPVFARVSIKYEGTLENIYGNRSFTPRPHNTGTQWIGASHHKNEVYHTTQLLPGVARDSIKNEGNREINYGNCNAASRPGRIIPGTLWIEGSYDKYGVYTTTYLFNGVARFSIKNEGTGEINYGNAIAASRPDRIIPGTL